MTPGLPSGALSARDIARAVREGRVSVEAVRARAEARLAEVAGLQAVCQRLDPPIRLSKSPGVSSEMMSGVPLLVKDLSFPVAGEICASGCGFPAVPARAHAVLLQRYLEAGAQVLGRSHSPELGGGSACESRHWGLATRNPYAPARSSGGSSGGAAVAVATGAVPIAHASDAGGSITIPAALCGVVGLKPTHGTHETVIPLGPDRIEGAAGFAAQNALTRDMGDAALALAVGAARPGLARIAPVGRLRIGLALQAVDGGPTEAGIAARLGALAGTLRALGHEVAEVRMPALTEQVAAAERALRLAALAATVAGMETAAGLAAEAGHFEPATWARIEAGRRVSGVEVLQARDAVLRWAAGVEALFARHDVILTPALNAPAPPVQALSLMRPDAETQPLNRHYTCFTRPWNLTGLPSLCLPLLRDGAGRPEGALFAAGPGQEALLLSLGTQLEEAVGWRHDHLETVFAEEDQGED